MVDYIVNKQNAMNILDLPEDIHFYLLRIYLSKDELFQYMETCKYFYNNVKEIQKLPKKAIPFHLKVIKNPSMFAVTYSMELLQWAETHEKFNYNQYSARYAARNGDLNILKYILKKSLYNFDPFVYAEAAQKGKFDIIKWCYKKKLKSNIFALSGACQYGDLDMIKWMLKKNFEYDVIVSINVAASCNNFDVVKFFVESNYYWDSSTFCAAAQSDDIRIIKYLYSKASHNLNYVGWLTSGTYCSAIECENFKMLEWLKKHYCPMDISCINTALEIQNYEILKWLIENKCPVYRELYYDLKKDNIITTKRNDVIFFD
jgi:hypothetical protein